jgi:hypothetical protein
MPQAAIGIGRSIVFFAFLRPLADAISKCGTCHIQRRKDEGGRRKACISATSAFILLPSSFKCGTCHIFFRPLHTAPAIDEFGLRGLSGTSILKSLILKFVGPPKAFAIAETIGYTLA